MINPKTPESPHSSAPSHPLPRTITVHSSLPPPIQRPRSPRTPRSFIKSSGGSTASCPSVASSLSTCPLSRPPHYSPLPLSSTSRALAPTRFPLFREDFPLPGSGCWCHRSTRRLLLIAVVFFFCFGFPVLGVERFARIGSGGLGVEGLCLCFSVMIFLGRF